MGFEFYESTLDTESLKSFSVILAINTHEILKLDNLKIKCAARITQDSDLISNRFEDIITLKEGLTNT